MPEFACGSCGTCAAFVSAREMHGSLLCFVPLPPEKLKGHLCGGVPKAIDTKGSTSETCDWKWLLFVVQLGGGSD